MPFSAGAPHIAKQAYLYAVPWLGTVFVCSTIYYLLDTTTSLLSIMRRTANNCEWLLRHRKENCGKPCVGIFCKQHNMQLKKGMKKPEPCRGCGVGVLCDFRLCIRCGVVVTR